MPYYTGARSEGMGEAFTSLADNNEGLYYNPAALAFMKVKKPLPCTGTIISIRAIHFFLTACPPVIGRCFRGLV